MFSIIWSSTTKKVTDKLVKFINADYTKWCGLLTLLTPTKKVSESLGSGGGLISPPRRLILAAPLV